MDFVKKYQAIISSEYIYKETCKLISEIIEDEGSDQEDSKKLVIIKARIEECFKVAKESYRQVIEMDYEKFRKDLEECRILNDCLDMNVN